MVSDQIADWVGVWEEGGLFFNGHAPLPSTGETKIWHHTPKKGKEDCPMPENETKFLFKFREGKEDYRVEKKFNL